MSKASDIIYLIEYEVKGKPDFKTLKKNKVDLTPEERKIVMDRKAVWHMANNESHSSAVWKSEINGQVWYVTNTHRAFNVTKTLKGTIKRYHDFIKGTA